MKDMTFLSHASAGGEQGDARSTCSAGGLEEATVWGDEVGREAGRGPQVPHPPPAAVVWPDEAEGLQRFGR